MSVYYHIVNASHNNIALDVKDGSNARGGHLIVWPLHHGLNQQFRIVKKNKTDGSVWIQCRNSNFFLDVEGGVKHGADIIQWEFHGGENQTWVLAADGTIGLQGHNLVLDIKGGAIQQGTSVIAWDKNGAANQHWKLIPVEHTEPEYFYVCSAMNANMVLDIHSGTGERGGHLIVYPFHGGNNQQFTIVKKNNDDVWLQARHSELYLDVEGGVKHGADIIQWDLHGGVNQTWVLYPDGTIGLRGQNLVLDIKGGVANPSTTVCAWDKHGGANQRWTLKRVEPLYHLVSELDHNYVIDVEGGAKTPLTHLIAFTIHRGRNQQFRLVKNFANKTAPEGSTWIQCRDSELFLDVEGGVVHGANIIQFGFHGGENQTWVIGNDGVIQVRNHNLVLDIRGGVAKNNVTICAWDRHNGPNQRFKLVPVAPENL